LVRKVGDDEDWELECLVLWHRRASLERDLVESRGIQRPPVFFYYYFESVLFPEILCARYVPSINKPMFAAVSEVSSEQLFWKRRAMLNKRKEHTPFLLSRVITLHLYLGFPGLEPGWSLFFSFSSVR
jgi:hypothetical protein